MSYQHTWACSGYCVCWGPQDEHEWEYGPSASPYWLIGKIRRALVCFDDKSALTGIRDAIREWDER